MNLDHLQTFLAVADGRSFTRAADNLNVSKGLVSRHIQKLEKTLNTKLFHRSTRKIVLTETGTELYQKAKQIQNLAIEAEMRLKDITQDISGDLKITAPMEFGRLLCRDVIPAFMSSYPDVHLILDLGNQKKQIESGDFDIAFRAYDELPNDVIAKDLGYIRNVLVCSPNSNAKNLHDIAHIHNYDFIANSQKASWNILELHSDTEQKNIDMMGTLGSNTYHSILELAKQGLGVACLPYYQVEDDLKRGELVHLLTDWSVRTHKLSIIYAPRKTTPQKIKVFNNEVQKWLANNTHYMM